MLKNYIKIAWKVMMRRKVFTGITLTVIALYLMMMTIMATFIDLATNNYPPETRRSETLTVNRITLKKDGETRGSSSLSRQFIEDFILPMESPKYTVISGSGSMRFEGSNGYWRIKYINADFWKMMDLNFIEGRPFNAKEVQEASQVAVISEHLKEHLYGSESALGKTLNEEFVIIGVIKDVHSFSRFRGQVFMPYTLDEGESERPPLGDYAAYLLPESDDQMDKIKAEYANQISKVDYNDPDWFNEIQSEALSHKNEFQEAMNMPWDALLILGSLFFLLPASSLLNINTSRILERYSEIGVRKAFGASSRVLVGQFLVENLIFSILGGILGFILSAIIFEGFAKSLLTNFSAVFPEGHSLINWRVFMACLLLSIIYGIATGVYPAWRMSKVHPVHALRYSG